VGVKTLHNTIQFLSHVVYITPFPMGIASLVRRCFSGTRATWHQCGRGKKSTGRINQFDQSHGIRGLEYTTEITVELQRITRIPNLSVCESLAIQHFPKYQFHLMYTWSTRREINLISFLHYVTLLPALE